MSRRERTFNMNISTYIQSRLRDPRFIKELEKLRKEFGLKERKND